MEATPSIEPTSGATPDSSWGAAQPRIEQMQHDWARSVGLSPDGQGYVATLDQNLRQALAADTRAEFLAGKGGELGRDGERGKMQSLHSSSAVACNVFDYWRERERTPLEYALHLPAPIAKLEFEQPFRTGMRSWTPPHLDVALTLATREVIGIESKFIEPYRKPMEADFSPAYFPAGRGRWDGHGLVGCEELVRELRARPDLYKRLDAAQLLKHALGLAHSCPGGFALWYLWFDAGKPEGNAHRKEIEDFARRTGPELRFRAASHQELIAALATHAGAEHPEYVSYLQRRYGRVPA